MLLGVHKYICFIHSIHMGVLRHTWVCQKKIPTLSLQYFKMELSYDTDFFAYG